MTPPARERLIVGSAFAVVALVTVFAIWPTHYDIPAPPAVEMSPMPSLAVTLTHAAIDAPLFSASRTPTEALPEPSPNAAPPAQPPTLVGIAANRQSAVALLRSSTGETVTANIGDVVDGWTVASIARDHVSLIRGADHQDIGIDFSNAPKAAQMSGSSVQSSPPPFLPTGPK